MLYKLLFYKLAEPLIYEYFLLLIILIKSITEMKEQKEPIFTYKMKVRDYELDVQGIVNNANYQHYYEAGRHEFLETCNASFIEAHNSGTDPVVSSISIKYRQPLKSLDEFYVTVNLKKEGIRYIFFQKIIRASDNQVCSEATVEVVCTVDGKVVKPDYYDLRLGKYLE